MMFPFIYDLRSFVLVGLLMGGVGCSDASRDSTPGSVAEEAPHIVLILADDLGPDVGPCSNDLNLMPNLEARCRDALYFSRAYSYPYCTASRAALMTGRHMFRHGANDVQANIDKLPLSENTIAEVIKRYMPHYRTAAFGKWHLTGGGQNENVDNPNRQGFDHFEGHPRQYGTYDFAANSYDWYVNGENMGPVDKYKATQITDSIIADFENNKDRPQFYYINYVLPHFPYHVPPDHLHNFTLDPPPDEMNVGVLRRTEDADPYFFAMLQALDSELARLLAALDASTDRSILYVFLGDNGTANEVYQGDLTGGWYRGKASLFEGGIRVPLMVWMSGESNLQLPTGVTDMLVNTFDLYPTLLDVMRIEPFPRDIDAESFFGVFADLAYESREILYLESGHDRRLAYNYAAIDQHGMKLILQERDRRRERIEFFDLISYYDTRADPAEAINLITQMPCSVSFANIYRLLDFMKNKRADAPNDPAERFDYELYLTTIRGIEANCRLAPKFR